jgi:hypothetical protein
VGRPRGAGGQLGEFACALFDAETGIRREFQIKDAAGESLVNGFLKPVAWLGGDRIAWVGRSLGVGAVPLQLVITDVKRGVSQTVKLRL